MKLVSVVMPTYKRELMYVQRALESLLEQSYKRIEIIVIDDSPKEYKHRSTIENYIKSLQDNRIIYVKNEENLGGSLARNVGIKRARGFYTTFLDDDDKYLVNKIKAQVEFMNSSDYDMSFSNMLIKNMSEKLVDVRDYHDVKSFERDDFLKYHLMRHATGTPTFMYKTERLKEIGGFDDAIMGQEFYLMLKTIERGLKIGYLNRYDVVVYKHSGEAISKGNNKIIGENLLYERKKQYFKLFNTSQISFIKMRHYAVLAVAHKRNGNYYGLIENLIKAFVSAPIQMIKEGINFVKKVLCQRRLSSTE